MIMELVGARILAPYLGTSMFVWASLIGIVLGALTIGYYLGGHFSEKNPTLNFLATVLLLAGLSILFIGFVKDEFLPVILCLGIKMGSVLATLFLFALPSVLLGMVSPYAIRLKIKDIQTSGEVAGKLYALSTIGSIVGTFAAGFYLIPTFGSAQIIFGLSAGLVLTALIVRFDLFKISTLILVIISSLLISNPAQNLIFEADSEYNHIRVVDHLNKDERPIRILYLATEAHSVIYQDSDELFPGYFKHYQLDQVFNPNIKKALTLGGGAYVGPVDFLKRFPKSKMTVVEIDPKVTETAKNYFRLKVDPRLSIIHADGRIFLNNNHEKYDAIYGDAFSSFYSIPFHLTTREAIEKIYNSLNDNGIFLLNVISSIEGETSMFFQSEYKTLSLFFPQIYIFPVYYSETTQAAKHQNIVIVATKDSQRKNLAELESYANENQQELLRHLWPNEIKIEPKIKILTDNFAPVDYYISKLL